ncbi:MAG: 5-deoxy-glucuronate isomerase [Breznakia sp.]
MEKKVFGKGKYIDNEMLITSYDNAYAHMKMDIRAYQLHAQEELTFTSEKEEIVVLLLNGDIDIIVGKQKVHAKRSSVFLDDPYAAHVCRSGVITIKTHKDSEILVQKAVNEKSFVSKIYTPKDIHWHNAYEGKWNNSANRYVNTIIDHEINEKSNFVLGEIRNRSGNWSGYLPHRHPQVECYFFLFDHEAGFGASFIDDDVYKSVNYSYAVIPGGSLHPQVCAPGFQMYTCWIIRHDEDHPWLQTDRNEEARYTWLHDVD